MRRETPASKERARARSDGPAKVVRSRSTSKSARPGTSRSADRRPREGSNSSKSSTGSGPDKRRAAKKSKKTGDDGSRVDALRGSGGGRDFGAKWEYGEAKKAPAKDKKSSMTRQTIAL